MASNGKVQVIERQRNEWGMKRRLLYRLERFAQNKWPVKWLFGASVRTRLLGAKVLTKGNLIVCYLFFCLTNHRK